MKKFPIKESVPLTIVRQEKKSVSGAKRDMKFFRQHLSSEYRSIRQYFNFYSKRINLDFNPQIVRISFNILIGFGSFFGTHLSAEGRSSSIFNLQSETERRVRNVLDPLLGNYCSESCRIVDIRVSVEEEIPDGDNMGFESVLGEKASRNLYVSQINVNIQIDEKVDGLNRERLEKIILINMRPLGLKSVIDWSSISVPRIGRMSGLVGQLKQKLMRRLTTTLNKSIQKYCPSQCIIERIEIDGVPISLDEAESLVANQLVKDSVSGGVLRIDNVDIEIALDEKLDQDSRNRIIEVMKAKTRFINGINMMSIVRAFPETYEEKRERERKLADDPYGLEKLRRMLIMFRDLAGTKEIISSSEKSALENRTSEASSQVSSDSSVKSDSRSDQISDTQATLEEMAIWGGLLLLLTLAIIAIFRFSKANREANSLVLDGVRNRSSAEVGSEGDVGSGLKESDGKKSLGSFLNVQELKNELIDLFMENPKVAKETFSRILKEDGVEETSKYVSIFGHLIIFELLDDPSMQRDLYELGEYFHTSEFVFTKEEEYELLKKLRTRCTASEIRVLTRKASEKFEFLNKLDPGQIYKLVSEESIQVQTIVLTQLDRKRRRALFDMYVGQSKVDLLQQLSMAEAIPKEFLFNVAKALSRKVSSRPEFDTENLRSSDILIDLLEKADLDDQRKLMTQLQETNPDTARSVKMSLVTVEIMPYLKDGHLLELILGMERDDLMTFLMGTREHVRDLLLRKAPEELADSWIEDMESMASVDENSYRVAEMKIIARIRGLVNNGVINLLEINDMIFEVPDSNAFSTDEVDSAPLNPASMSAA